MKPKTKLHIEVNKVSKRLPKIADAHKKWASANVFGHYIYRTKDQHTCMECGHSWERQKNEPALSYLLTETCPKCHITLKTHPEPKKRKHREVEYFSIATTHDRFQVIRYIHATRHYKAGERADISLCEVAQHWITPEGQDVIRAVKPSMNVYGYNDGWSLYTDMEIRGQGNYTRTSPKYYINTKYVYPNRKIIPEVRRNGYRFSTHGWNETYFFSMILTSPCAETLLKAKQYGLIKKFESFDEKITRYWSSIRICMRNNYIIKDAGTWFDHLNLLEYFHKDILNAKYICPENLEAEHQRLNNKRQAILDREEFEERRSEIAEANKKFKKAKSKFFGIIITNGEIDIVVLDNIEEYYKEGQILHHCVCKPDYYENNNSLILSARMGNERLETIELDLKAMKIIQSRGLQNQPTKYHKQIIELMNTYIPEIKKIVKLKQVA